MSHDEPPSSMVHPARSEELAPAFRLVFQHLDTEDQETRLRNALELVRQGELDPEGILVVRGGPELLGAMICLPVPGASGLVWPPQARGRANTRRAIEDQLAQTAVRWLRQRGAKLAQALLTAQEGALADSLERNGFAHVTSLWYMRRELDLPASVLLMEDPLEYVTYADSDPAVFQQALLRTYEDSQDCPEVTGVRSIEEIMEGHRHQGLHDPERWWLAWKDHRPAGVLLVTQMAEYDGWDLSYLGVVPEARRQGVGRLLTRKAILEARAAEVTQLTLSVDRRNGRAWNLYRQLGFEAYDQREVYLKVMRTED